MEITDIKPFLKYFFRIRERSLRVINEIPKEKLEWSPYERAFSFADIIRHLGGIELDMYARTIKGQKSKYKGHVSEITEISNPIEYLEKCHKEALSIFSSLTSDDLISKCTTPAGHQITVWKWLRAMIEHEIHHRGQIYTYLGILEVRTTPIYGLTSEEVKNMSEN